METKRPAPRTSHLASQICLSKTHAHRQIRSLDHDAAGRGLDEWSFTRSALLRVKPVQTSLLCHESPACVCEGQYPPGLSEATVVLASSRPQSKDDGSRRRKTYKTSKTGNLPDSTRKLCDFARDDSTCVRPSRSAKAIKLKHAHSKAPHNFLFDFRLG